MGPARRGRPVWPSCVAGAILTNKLSPINSTSFIPSNAGAGPDCSRWEEEFSRRPCRAEPCRARPLRRHFTTARRSGGAWTARLGVNGLKDRRREGDGTTPTGVYSIGPVMYGSAPNPGVRYRYRKVACGDWWVEDPASTAYNSFQHVPCGRRPPFRTNHPGMWQDPVAYRHLAVIEFNMRPVVAGRGSGIFLHVSKGRPTAGCISLPASQLIATLRWLRPGKRPLIAIGTRETFRRV